MEWVCGFLLTLQGPLYPTPARKQIKLQFHHLEGAVSCPKAAPRLPTYTLAHTKLYTSASSRGPRRPPPKCQPLSTARLPGGMEGFEGRKRARGGMGGCRRGLGVRAGILLQFHPTEIFCSREERTGRETDGGGGRLRGCGNSMARPPSRPSMLLLTINAFMLRFWQVTTTFSKWE